LGHSSAPGSSVDSEWATTVPAIDGAMSPGEWADAVSLDLSAVSGNYVSAFMLLKNNDTTLWLAYDAVGDTTLDLYDGASFGADTGHDGLATVGAEDQFVLGGWGGLPSEHWVSGGSSNWTLHESPFDPGLPGHAGLAGALGFGVSDLSATDHRLYEFQIPLALIGVAPGATIGLFGGSYPLPGVYDQWSGGYSSWPASGWLPLDAYGDLTLSTAPGPVGVSLSPSSASAFGQSGSNVTYNIRVRNLGTAVNDTVDIAATSNWPVALWDASGTILLADTDSDGVPDSGNLTSGSSTLIVVTVSIPGGPPGCSSSLVTATSSWNTSVLDTSNLTTCAGPALLTPPHADSGLDANANGFFDYLVVDVNVSVGLSDTYFLSAELRSGDGATSIWSVSNYFYPNPGPATFPNYFDGTAIFLTGLDGPYRVELSLYDSFGGLLDNGTYITGAYLHTEFDPPPAYFTPPHSDVSQDTDVPPNGLLDALVLNVSFVIGFADTYSLAGDLWDPFGSYITHEEVSGWYDPGSFIVPLTFAGPDLYRSGFDGPYTIGLALYDPFGFQVQDTYVTGPYVHTDFDPPPIAFAPPHGDAATDIDVPPDGFFDWLTVTVQVLVDVPSNYTVQGYLYGPGGWPSIDSAQATRAFGPGPSAVELNFSGTLIRDSARTGNFQVTLIAGTPSGNMSWDVDYYITNSYDFTAFQPPPGLFSPPHVDSGIDTSQPPDGWYDWFEIDAFVDVTHAGHFTVVVELSAPGFYERETGSAALPLGRGFVPVRFDGYKIEQLGGSRSFSVYLYLYDDLGDEIDFDSYTTIAYAASQFQPPDVALPSSTATLVGGYWSNAAVLRVDVDATDAAPSDGIAAVTLYYRYSPNNVTWFPWTPFETKSTLARGDASIAPSFLVNLPAGEAYYEFYSVAVDFGGNAEAAPAVADAAVAAFLPARLDLIPAAGTVVAGTATGLDLRVVNSLGMPVILERPLVVSLVATSALGEFRLLGVPVTQVTLPTGGSGVALEYVDAQAGTAILTSIGGGVTAGSAAILVTSAAAASLAISPTSVAIPVGGTASFAAAVSDRFGNLVPSAPLSWAVTGGIGTVSSGGLFTAGTLTLSATVTVESGGMTAIASVTVLSGPLDHIAVSPAVATILENTDLELRAWASDAFGNPVVSASFTWALTGPGTLSGTTGDSVTVTATGAGTITATSTSGTSSATATITATSTGAGPLDHIVLSTAFANVLAGSSLPLTVVGYDADGQEVTDIAITWSLQGPGALSATTGATIILTASGAGTITVTAMAGGKSATASITVTAGGGTGAGGAPGDIGLGFAGGAVAGLVAGVLATWLLVRRPRREPPTRKWSRDNGSVGAPVVKGETPPKPEKTPEEKAK